MSQICKTCSNNKRLEIDRALVTGKSKSRIAQEFDVTVDSLSYHETNHLSHQLVTAYQKREALEGLNLLGEIEDLLARTKRILTKAEKKEQHNLALSAIREARGVYELLSKIAFALHQARLAELELEKERSGEAERERQEDYDGRYAVLTNAEFDLFGQLLEKIQNQDKHTIIVPHRADEVFFDHSMLTSPEEEPEPDTENEHPPIKMRRTKRPTK